MRIILIIIGFLISDSLTAQYWVGRDAIGFELNTIEILFNIDSKVKFDIDCDGMEDFHIQSYSKKTNLSPWIQLIISMEDNVEVLIGFDWSIRKIEKGDTLFLSDGYWIAKKSSIFETGAGGPEGNPRIDEKYISFRKIRTLDTSYCYIKLSSINVDFTIHEVISNCDINPIEIIRPLEGLYFFPNPVSYRINFAGEVEKYEIYNLNGKLLISEELSTNSVKLNWLREGIYIIRLIGEGKSKEGKLIKI